MVEIRIDFATTRRIVRDELTQARADIAALGPLAALQRSQRRQDESLAAAPDAHTLDCKAGCAWCCHFSVDIRPVEAFRIVEFMRTLPAQQQEQIRSEIAAQRARLAPLDDLQRMQTNVKCPFLTAGRCAIYAARPQTCRNYHATNVAGCRHTYEHPQDLEIDPDFAPMVYQIGGAHVEAFSRAMAEAGYDVAAYEMNLLLDIVLNDATLRDQFERKQRPFPAEYGMEVPPDFMDEDSELAPE